MATIVDDNARTVAKDPAVVPPCPPREFSLLVVPRSALGLTAVLFCGIVRENRNAFDGDDAVVPGVDCACSHESERTQRSSVRMGSR